MTSKTQDEPKTDGGTAGRALALGNGKSKSDHTGRKQASTQFKPGQSGNPAGRPKGAKSKLSETFVKALLEDFEANGATAIAEARETNPGTYLKVIASIMPKDVNITGNWLDDFSSWMAERGRDKPASDRTIN